MAPGETHAPPPVSERRLAAALVALAIAASTTLPGSSAGARDAYAGIAQIEGEYVFLAARCIGTLAGGVTLDVDEGVHRLAFETVACGAFADVCVGRAGADGVVRGSCLLL